MTCKQYPFFVLLSFRGQYPDDARPKHTFALLRVLAEVIGASYIEIALETYVICAARFPARQLILFLGPQLHLQTPTKRLNHLCSLYKSCVRLTSSAISGNST